MTAMMTRIVRTTLRVNLLENDSKLFFIEGTG